MLNKEYNFTYRDATVKAVEYESKLWIQIVSICDALGVPRHTELTYRKKQTPATRTHLVATDAMGRPSKMAFLSVKGAIIYLHNMFSDNPSRRDTIDDFFRWIKHNIIEAFESARVEDLQDWMEMDSLPTRLDRAVSGFYEAMDQLKERYESNDATPETSSSFDFSAQSYQEFTQKTADYISSLETKAKTLDRARVRIGELKDELAEAEIRNDELRKKICESHELDAETRLKAAKYDLLIQSPALMSATEIAQSFHFGTGRELNLFLEAMDVIYRLDDQSIWILKSKYAHGNYGAYLPVMQGGHVMLLKTGKLNQYWAWNYRGKELIWDLLTHPDNWTRKAEDVVKEVNPYFKEYIPELKLQVAA